MLGGLNSVAALILLQRGASACYLSFAGLYSQESTTRSPESFQVVSVTDRVLPSDFINILGEEDDFKCDVSY
ncbi:MAG TPA: hypothetical protein DCE56_30350 [Cyanobacteria bacterium UBA8553]|nr:hypothetical protein [Cyanobacteria bacterium UBA8553]